MPPPSVADDEPLARVIEPLHIEHARPAACGRCHACNGLGDQVAIHGHGVRWRTVVIAGPDQAQLAIIGIRRFKCRRCGWSCSVPPIPIEPHHTYALAAMLTAWLLGLPRPLGDGLSERAVCALQGVDRRSGDPISGRWRSPRRWMRSIGRWWPMRPQGAVALELQASGLLYGFVPGDGTREGVIRRALRAHAAAGGHM